ncbi:hypothetical protein FB192DRAFT_1003673 [Mucor lusitanicus]|uniref:Homeobox domain-containing protein n=1 Tax=Mucor circinelloides f. lusitanicus TaxID=29924 RepID=A0A8H4BPL7_MUCCL|nr:hypothetical protein FB192DRAFT_1003673 [Mucor lusitanicus]
MNNPSSSSSSLHSLHQQQYSAMPSLPLPPPPPPHSVIPNDKESSAESTSTPRKRTRATPEQLAVLEKTFNVNPSPNNRVREQLSRELGMSERSIQIWFQNRRAKVKNVAKKSSMLHDETLRMQYYASSAAAAACQAAVYQQRQKEGKDISEVMEDPIKSNPDLYYYYYYYYFNQQQQLQHRQKHHHQVYHPYMQQQQQQHQRYHSSSSSSSASVPPPPISLKSMPPPPPPPPHSIAAAIVDDTTGSISPSDTLKSDPYSQWSKKEVHQQRARAHTIGPYPSNFQHQSNSNKQFRGSSAELSNKNPMIPLSINTSNIVENINYTSMMNTASSLSPNQHEQFANLTVQDLSFYDQHPHLQQQQQQQQQHHHHQQEPLTWTDLPFYEDPSLMMTPTTPSIFTANNNNPYDIPSSASNATHTASTTHTTNTQIISAEALQIETANSSAGASKTVFPSSKWNSHKNLCNPSSYHP